LRNSPTRREHGGSDPAMTSSSKDSRAQGQASPPSGRFVEPRGDGPTVFVKTTVSFTRHTHLTSTTCRGAPDELGRTVWDLAPDARSGPRRVRTTFARIQRSSPLRVRCRARRSPLKGCAGCGTDAFGPHVRSRRERSIRAMSGLSGRAALVSPPDAFKSEHRDRLFQTHWLFPDRG
jgi:hypothetical protein